VWFCGRDCQKLAWPQHKGACQQVQAELQLQAGMARFQQGDVRGALSKCEGAAKAFSKAPGGRRYCEASLLVGECHKLLQNATKAGAAFETALAAAVDDVQKSEVLSAQATLASARHDWGKSESLLQEALGLVSRGVDGECDQARRRQALRAQGVAYSNLGKCLSGQGKVAEAVECFESALRCRRSSNAEPSELATTATNLASALIMRSGDAPTLGAAAASAGVESGKPEEASADRARALSLYTEALNLAEANGLKKLLQPLLINLSNYHEECDQSDSRAQAAKYRERLVRLMSELGRTDLPSECVICLDALKVEKLTTADERVTVLECLHFFHKECLERGMQQQHGGGCPACRRAIF
jgi:tetratricopeptide (TPR) repeat protein